MKETLIYKLNKHNIYYISTPSYGFYILVPFTDYTDTNIVLRLKGNYQSYDLNKNSLESVTEELINYYKSIDNYNVTLVLPIFYDGILDRIRTVEDLVLYQRLDGYLGNIFNNAYAFLTKNNIKVNSNIYIINNDSFKTFTNWFVSRYNNRIEYKTILELVKQSDHFNSYDMVETHTIKCFSFYFYCFIKFKNEEPKLDKTVEIETETFNSMTRDIVDTESKKKETFQSNKKNNAGFVSYILLGVVSFVVSMLLLFLFIK